MNFTINQIPGELVLKMKNTLTWTQECPVAIERLKLLEISHYSFFNNIETGQLVVLDKIAENVLKIFEQLLIVKFPIKSIKPIDSYNGNDELSMNDNNSSCFNFRPIAGSDHFSIHSYGLAIDINPIQNPFIEINDKTGIVEIFPKEGVKYLNRGNIRAGMVEPIVEIFKKQGFEWGGNWNSPIDYHHFQLSRGQVPELIA